MDCKQSLHHLRHHEYLQGWQLEREQVVILATNFVLEVDLAGELYRELGW